MNEKKLSEEMVELEDDGDQVSIDTRGRILVFSPTGIGRLSIPEAIELGKLAEAYQAEQEKENKPYRCPECGYTEEDARIHMDHHICVAKGGPPMPSEVGK